MSSLKNASEIAMIERMPTASRPSMGICEKEAFINRLIAVSTPVVGFSTS
jgi:hypothetical protein